MLPTTESNSQNSAMQQYLYSSHASSTATC